MLHKDSKNSVLTAELHVGSVRSPQPQNVGIAPELSILQTGNPKPAMAGTITMRFYIGEMG